MSVAFSPQCQMTHMTRNRQRPTDRGTAEVSHASERCDRRQQQGRGQLRLRRPLARHQCGLANRRCAHGGWSRLGYRSC